MDNSSGTTPPLVPAEVNLREFSRFPLEFERLFKSDTWALASDEQRVACLYLWCNSWHQVPAGSLPADERVLAELSRTGRRWRRLREHCLRGWVKCTDGRLYHPVVAEKAIEAFAVKQKMSRKGKAGAEARWGSTGTSSGTSGAQPVDRSDLFTDSGMPVPLPDHGIEGKGREGKGVLVAGGNGAYHFDAPFELPAWVSPGAWSSFEQMRNREKKPMTDRARWAIVKELDHLSGKDPEKAAAVLDQSNVKGWLDVYPLKRGTAGGPPPAGGHRSGGGGATLEDSNRAAALAAATRKT